MSFVRKCDTCSREEDIGTVEEGVSLELPLHWSTDEIGRDVCNVCGHQIQELEKEVPDEAQMGSFVKELNKETKRLLKIKKIKKIKKTKKEEDGTDV